MTLRSRRAHLIEIARVGLGFIQCLALIAILATCLTGTAATIRHAANLTFQEYR